MSRVRAVLISSLCGAALMLSGCGGDDGESSSEGADAPATESNGSPTETNGSPGETAESPQDPADGEAGDGDAGDGDLSAPTAGQGLVTVDGTTWEFEMSIACSAMFGSVTFAGENEDGSVGVSGGFVEDESDSGLEVNVIGGITWELVPGSDFTIEDDSVSGSGEFRDADQPDRTAPGTFQIAC